MRRAEPVYATYPGWGPLPASCRAFDDLPAPARAYVQSIERLAGAPLALVSVGPERTQTIVIDDVLLRRA